MGTKRFVPVTKLGTQKWSISATGTPHLFLNPLYIYFFVVPVTSRVQKITDIMYAKGFLASPYRTHSVQGARTPKLLTPKYLLPNNFETQLFLTSNFIEPPKKFDFKKKDLA